jgi:vacuolar-type H+-ATPase subunit E/Vma4
MEMHMYPDEYGPGKGDKKSQMNTNEQMLHKKNKKEKTGAGTQRRDELNDVNGKQKLIEGIKEDARQEAEKILKQAEKYAGDRKKTVESQVNRIMNQAREKADNQVALIKRNIKSSISVEIKRLNLKIMDRIMSSTVERVKRDIAGMIGTPGYPDILLGWIIEAAIGLNVNEASVNTSLKETEYITEELLKKAADTIFSLTGKKVALKKSTDSPLLAQGVVLYAKDGKTAFNNQIPTRLLRYQSEVRKMIYTSLYRK